MHPSGVCLGVAGAMTVPSGETGLLSQVIERGAAGSCGFASSPGVWRPSIPACQRASGAGAGVVAAAAVGAVTSALVSR